MTVHEKMFDNKSYVPEKKPTVMVSGGFDPVHAGHIRMIRDAANFGNVIVIANSDDWLYRKKGFVFMTFAQRAEILNAIKGVIKNCIKTKGIKVEQLPTFDIEYLFLNIRGKSVGEEIEVNIICPDDGETEVPVTINIDDIHIQKNQELEC